MRGGAIDIMYNHYRCVRWQNVMQKSSIEKLGYWINIVLSPLHSVYQSLMGARAIYNIPGRVHTDSYTVHTTAINGANKKVMLNNHHKEGIQVIVSWKHK